MASRMNSGQLAFPLEPERRIFRVSELNGALQRHFEAHFSGIWVAGEISSCKLATSGHYYFSLKDEGSQIKSVLFKGSARFVRFRPADGLAVIARGRLEIYEARGEYQLIVESMEPQGAGALQLAFEQLKKQLALEGLFDASRKRQLPRYPKRVGLITSPSGAVIRDILQVLERRFPGLHLRLYPAQVQGEAAVEQVCEGLKYFSGGGWAEVVILARGGGSLEDLWAFNEEAVARALAASAVPVISAIGHETDFTIADFVADLRAPTPSAAAEMMICTRDSLLEEIDTARQRALRSVQFRLLENKQRLLDRGTHRAEAPVQRAITRRAQRVDDFEFVFRRKTQAKLSEARRSWEAWRARLQATDLRLKFARNRHRLEMLHQSLQKSFDSARLRRQRRLDDCDLHLRQLSPLTVLSRGYAIVAKESGRVLRSPADTSKGETLHVRLEAGGLLVRVEASDQG